MQQLGAANDDNTISTARDVQTHVLQQQVNHMRHNRREYLRGVCVETLCSRSGPPNGLLHCIAELAVRATEAAASLAAATATNVAACGDHRAGCWDQ